LHVFLPTFDVRAWVGRLLAIQPDRCLPLRGYSGYQPHVRGFSIPRCFYLGVWGSSPVCWLATVDLNAAVDRIGLAESARRQRPACISVQMSLKNHA
jgi:hypothetical protein